MSKTLLETHTDVEKLIDEADELFKKFSDIHSDFSGVTADAVINSRRDVEITMVVGSCSCSRKNALIALDTYRSQLQLLASCIMAKLD